MLRGIGESQQAEFEPSGLCVLGTATAPLTKHLFHNNPTCGNLFMGSCGFGFGSTIRKTQELSGRLVVVNRRFESGLNLRDEAKSAASLIKSSIKTASFLVSGALSCEQRHAQDPRVAASDGANAPRALRFTTRSATRRTMARWHGSVTSRTFGAQAQPTGFVTSSIRIATEVASLLINFTRSHL